MKHQILQAIQKKINIFPFWKKSEELGSNWI